jgi:hypothetical protein
MTHPRPASTLPARIDNLEIVPFPCSSSAHREREIRTTTHFETIACWSCRAACRQTGKYTCTGRWSNAQRTCEGFASLREDRILSYDTCHDAKLAGSPVAQCEPMGVITLRILIGIAPRVAFPPILTSSEADSRGEL